MKKRCILVICAITLLTLVSCGSPQTAEITPSQPEQTLLLPSSPPEVALTLVDDVVHNPWSLTVSNDSLGVSLSLYASDFERSLGSGYTTTLNFDKSNVIFIYSDLGLDLGTDAYGYVNYISVDSKSGWAFNDKIALGSTMEEVTGTFGASDSSRATYLFSSSGELANYESADALVTFSTLGGVVNGISLSTMNQLPAPFLTADGVCTLYDIFPSDPNSAGGVNAEISFTNTSGKDIKYITFEVTPYNQVLDPVASEIGGESTVTVKGTGPFAPSGKGRLHSLVWENVWYNKTIYLILINSVNIEYMDGSFVSLDAPDP